MEKHSPISTDMVLRMLSKCIKLVIKGLLFFRNYRYYDRLLCELRLNSISITFVNTIVGSLTPEATLVVKELGPTHNVKIFSGGLEWGQINLVFETLVSNCNYKKFSKSCLILTIPIINTLLTLRLPYLVCPLKKPHHFTTNPTPPSICLDMYITLSNLTCCFLYFI